MDEEFLFLTPSFDNLSDFQEMFEYLYTGLIKRIDGDRPTIDSKITSYRKFLQDRYIPDQGKKWEYVFNDYISMFQNAVIWQAPGAMINVTPPANIPSIIAAFFAMLFNPNFATDESTGFLTSTELIVIKYLAQLVHWDKNNYGGLFTFGGKGTNLYALQMGLREACPKVKKDGIFSDQYIVFTNDKAHPCHIEVAEWMGLGSNSVCVLPTTKSGQVNLEIFEKQMREAIHSKKKIACIYLNGGSTNEGFIDPIYEVVQIRDRIVEEYQLTYKPHIHVDAVIGWVWLFFKSYDFEKNSLKMNSVEIKKVQSICSKIREIEYADSFGADFHKMGFCPYVSSAFVVRNSSVLECSWHCTYSKKEDMYWGEYTPFEYSLELTRSSIGPVSAFITLELLGIQGFQKLIYKVFSAGEVIRSIIKSNDEFEVINEETEGFATLFVVKPPGEAIQYKEIIRQNIESINSFVEYNHQFYLFVQNAYNKKKIRTKITFSRSYKPYGSLYKTGALKIYQMSPIVSTSDWNTYIQEIIDLKKEYDSSNTQLSEPYKIPKDMVYK